MAFCDRLENCQGESPKIISMFKWFQTDVFQTPGLSMQQTCVSVRWPQRSLFNRGESHTEDSHWGSFNLFLAILLQWSISVWWMYYSFLSFQARSRQFCCLMRTVCLFGRTVGLRLRRNLAQIKCLGRGLPNKKKPSGVFFFCFPFQVVVSYSWFSRHISRLSRRVPPLAWTATWRSKNICQARTGVIHKDWINMTCIMMYCIQYIV